jgi:hypothetical protein
MIRCILLLLILIGVAAPASAQGAPLVAFLNSAGQLVISSGDGGYRWIVTNPGETLVEPFGYSWSPNGDQLAFAVNVGSGVSLRVASAGSQSVGELGQIPSGQVSGGAWSGSSVLVSAAGQILLLDANSGAQTTVVSDPGTVSSGYGSARPNLPNTSALSDNFVLYQQGDGRYAVAAQDGSFAQPLNLTNDFDAPQSGLWSPDAPLVAYWGYSSSSALAVTNASTGASVQLDSGRSAPIPPLAWVGTRLIYRGADGLVRLAELACLTSNSCAGDELNQGVELLPATADEVQTDGTWVYFLNGNTVQAVNLGCIGTGDCLNSAQTVGDNAAPQGRVHAAGGTLVYTAFTADPNNPNDREVRGVDLGCLSAGTCSPVTVIGSAVAGLVSPDGRYVIVEQMGSGLSSLDLSTGNATYLSDAGAPLLKARWN